MQELRSSRPLGVEGLRVVGCDESVRGFEVHVKTTSSAGLCPECQAVTFVPKDHAGELCSRGALCDARAPRLAGVVMSS